LINRRRGACQFVVRWSTQSRQNAPKIARRVLATRLPNRPLRPHLSESTVTLGADAVHVCL
jgi:hypothetical protein